ncbi:hypothetical protein R69927_06590 [Paraburkholderia domus]|uniref:Uncharacterized protein n=1 Tax=Paraburkholderia domus TaxID=2793075 RepID=A0A9N8MU68_9BURK|nr:hypothetical protein R70006_03982 [Paraburkholderia domus]CAE6830809.1 hypothetical protein R75483_06692 [Paraburkholderia domus]CAE6885142.1 hypothetical protein R70199_02773 [Paraburkholderia domus]CAE6903238.1 hypothetical protein R70211_03423 [Paraburkholderia domus]CAE6904400.1 hypothetical protein R75471_03160 [Paraburkholderia domus]
MSRFSVAATRAMPGMSLFEEASYWGMLAANRAMT